MNQVNKQHELTINISPASRSNIITNTTFFSMDVETGKKIIKFTHQNDPVDLTNATVVLGFEFVGAGTSKMVDSQDGTVVIEDALSGICSVVLPNHLYDYEGQVLVHVYIKYEDGRSLDCGVIVTEFEASWLDREREEMSAFYIKRFEDLATEIQARVQEIEALLNESKSQLSTHHMLDETRHITQVDRESWNDRVTQAAFDKTMDKFDKKLFETATDMHQMTDRHVFESRQGQLLHRSLKGRSISDENVENASFLSVGEDANELKITTIGANIFDGIWERGMITAHSGVNAASAFAIRSRHFIEVIANETLYFNTNYVSSFGGLSAWHLVEFDSDKKFIASSPAIRRGDRFQLSQNTAYIRFRSSNMSGNLFDLNAKIALSYYRAIDPETPYRIASTTVEYQDADGTWKTPTLRSLLDGSTYDELTATEFLQRVEQTPSALIPLEQVRRYPVRMKRLPSFETMTNVIISSGSVAPEFTFQIATSLSERLQLVEERIRSLESFDVATALATLIEAMPAEQKDDVS